MYVHGYKCNINIIYLYDYTINILERIYVVFTLHWTGLLRYLLVYFKRQIKLSVIEYSSHCSPWMAEAERWRAKSHGTLHNESLSQTERKKTKSSIKHTFADITLFVNVKKFPALAHYISTYEYPKQRVLIYFEFTTVICPKYMKHKMTLSWNVLYFITS